MHVVLESEYPGAEVSGPVGLPLKMRIGTWLK